MKKKQKRKKLKINRYVCIQAHFPTIKCQIFDSSKLSTVSRTLKNYYEKEYLFVFVS